MTTDESVAMSRNGDNQSLSSSSTSDAGNPSTPSMFGIQSKPSTSHRNNVERSLESNQVEDLYLMFPSVPQAALKFLFDISKGDIQKVADCVLSGPTLAGIRELMINSLLGDHTRTLRLDEDDYMDQQSLAEAAVAHYKGPKFDRTASLRLSVPKQPGVDTGGMRRQFFNDVFTTVATSSSFSLFEGQTTRLRPTFRQSSVSSGILKTIGTMVGHSILMDLQGFPFLSPPCYYYIAGNIDLALSVTTQEDISERVKYVVSKVL